ncbi:MAG: YifB family Mg chelatase-like AAA ATPase [Actinomycetota bacterium]
MFANISSVAIIGMDARPVDVEVDLAAAGIPEFNIVGLPSAAIREARQRVRAAIENSGLEWPKRKIIASLAPSDLRKDGASLDLALAMGVLAAAGYINKEPRLAKFLFLGELALDGHLRPVRGALAAAITARDSGAEGIVVPIGNAAEAALVSGVHVVGADTLREVIAFTQGGQCAVTPIPDIDSILLQGTKLSLDLSDVRGQAMARRALEIAAAGSHNLLMVGPPGCGKTMLAQRLPSILPPMTAQEAFEVTHVWSIAGLLPPGKPLVTIRPFRSPHHHASASAVIGGGTVTPRPGEVSLAHNGVLFLDELPLYSTSILDGLRQPLEDGVVTVARIGATSRFPCKAALIAAANPCLCGERECSCPTARLHAYKSRLSGPLLDRIDMFVQVDRLSEEELLEMQPSESSATVRQRVVRARGLHSERLSGDQVAIADLDRGARRILASAFAGAAASARGFHRTIEVARTVANLAGSVTVDEGHVAEALMFRKMVWER